MASRINWDQYFMGVAKLSALRSKDPNTKVGACIVNSENRIVGVGYNGFPHGCEDDVYPWAREGEYYNTKYPYVVHAEMNCILNSVGRDLHGCKLYVSLFPCHECSKAIIQAGIKEVIYCEDKYNGTPSDIASKKMLDSAGVTYRKIDNIDIEVKL